MNNSIPNHAQSKEKNYSTFQLVFRQAIKLIGTLFVKKFWAFIVEYKKLGIITMIISSYLLQINNIISNNLHYIITYFPLACCPFLLWWDIAQRKSRKQINIIIKIHSLCESFMRTQDRTLLRNIYQNIYEALPKSDKDIMEIEKFPYPIVTQNCYDLMISKVKALHKKYA